ncbi:hypothetical protein DESC_120123 [Desulfosarcina cetonica]|nr:hypothetical protein DESC_120123 [Desulfosarcina cetonica]
MIKYKHYAYEWFACMLLTAASGGLNEKKRF